MPYVELPWEGDWGEKACQHCGHPLKEHPLMLVSDRDTNRRKATCRVTGCVCVLTNYGGYGD